MYIINFIVILTLHYLLSPNLLAKTSINNRLSKKKIIQNLNFNIQKKINSRSNINTLIFKKKYHHLKTSHSKIDVLLQQAKSYIGTSYEYGGTTRKGIDCSAFVKNVYSIININLNRISSNQALQGEIVSLNQAKKGDLLFFAHPGNQISHVGIIEHICHKNKRIFFIHSASSKGVVISSLNDQYWITRYKKTVRIIE